MIISKHAFQKGYQIVLLLFMIGTQLNAFCFTSFTPTFWTDHNCLSPQQLSPQIFTNVRLFSLKPISPILCWVMDFEHLSGKCYSPRYQLSPGACPSWCLLPPRWGALANSFCSPNCVLSKSFILIAISSVHSSLELHGLVLLSMKFSEILCGLYH